MFTGLEEGMSLVYAQDQTRKEFGDSRSIWEKLGGLWRSALMGFHSTMLYRVGGGSLGNQGTGIPNSARELLCYY